MAIRVGALIDTSQLDRLLAQLGMSVADLRPVWYRIDRDVTQLLREQFASRGARLGTPWAPLAPITTVLRVFRRMLSARARGTALRQPGADTPLRDTGGLWSSFTKPGSPFSLRIIDRLRYERGSRYTQNGQPVAQLMQEGFQQTHRPVITRGGDVLYLKRDTPKAVPARPILPEQLPAPVLRSWEGYLVQYLEQGAA